MVWIIAVSLASCAPTQFPLTFLTFNWTAPTAIALLLCISAAWYFSARNWFQGPTPSICSSDAVKVGPTTLFSTCCLHRDAQSLRRIPILSERRPAGCQRWHCKYFGRHTRRRPQQAFYHLFLTGVNIQYLPCFAWPSRCPFMRIVVFLLLSILMRSNNNKATGRHKCKSSCFYEVVKFQLASAGAALDILISARVFANL